MGKLHEQAEAAYNAKADAIVAEVQPRPPKQPSSTEAMPKVNGDTPIVSHFGEGDIDLKSFREYEVDYRGKRKACYFYTSSRSRLGITGAAHDTIEEPAQRIAGDRAYRYALSEKFVYDQAITWLQQKIDQPDVTPAFVRFIEDAAAKAITRHEIWLPIPGVQVTRPFQIGRTPFRNITKSMMDEWAEKQKVTSSPKAEASFERLRVKIQAATAACVEVEAEPIRGYNIAFSESEPSIAIFRLACPVIMNPYQWAPLDPSFIGRLSDLLVLSIQDSRIISQQSSLSENMPPPWLLKPEDIERHFRTVWTSGHDLIITRRNEFQDLLLSALIHYSKSILKSNTAERLLYVISALESLFIKDGGENIVQNLRERMAILMGPAQAERLKALDAISRVYDLRSSFVHRAVPVSDFVVLETFLFDVWKIMVFLLNNHNKWRTKADFLRHLDEHKFSGPTFSTENLPPLQPL